MGGTTKIEWCDHTFNPWRGCTQVSPGCDECYAKRWAKRNPKALGEWGPNGTRVIAAESYWRLPLKWDHDARAAGERRRVFCGSMMDWLELRPDLEGPRFRLLRLIVDTPNLDWLLLTKRPQNFQRATTLNPKLDAMPPNVWLGVSVESQAEADERIPMLLAIPAAVRFVSCEPLLSEVDMLRWLFSADDRARMDSQYLGPFSTAKVNWVIAGGESGPQARPSRPDWFRSLRDQCETAGVPFFFKQWGEWAPAEEVFDAGPGVTSKPCPRVMAETCLDGVRMVRCGRPAAGRLLDGREWNETPTRGGDD